MRTRLIGLALILGMTLGFSASPARADAVDAFKPLVYKDADGKTLPYRLFIPANYDAQKKYPLVLFFHGAGERGDDNRRQISNGAEVFVSDAVQRDHPCFVFAPQCPSNAQWVDVPWGDDKEVQPAEPSASMKLALGAVDELLKQYKIDSDRVYVTGLSMGGFATWDLISRYPDRFAAAVPVCGGGDEKAAARIAKLPIWAFHGGADTVVKTQRSRNMVAAIKAAGGDCKYTEYPGVGHNAWTNAYADKTMLAWLFDQKRKM